APITEEELVAAQATLENGKAPGPDNVNNEIIKAALQTPQGIKNLYTVFLAVWNEENVPDEWKNSYIVPTPKKGDLHLPTNYRGISLMSAVGKLFGKIILNRMTKVMEKNKCLLS